MRHVPDRSLAPVQGNVVQLRGQRDTGPGEDLLTYRRSFDLVHTPVQRALQTQFPGHQTDRPVAKHYGKRLGASLKASFTSRYSAIIAASATDGDHL